ncbi:methyltransferase domain-containing protein [Planctomycetota bacterium]
MKLNLGSGADYREGWVNLDKGNCNKDVDHDLEDLPLPFADSCADEIHMIQVLEHISRDRFVDFMREIHRIAKPNALVVITCPYYLSKNAFTDFTHKNFMTEDSFGYFDNSSQLRAEGQIYGIDFTFRVNVALNADRHYPECSIIYELTVEK